MSPQARAIVREFAYAFLAAFIPTFIGLATGWANDLSAGHLPNMHTATAALAAAALSAILAAIKAVTWSFTGTGSGSRVLRAR